MVALTAGRKTPQRDGGEFGRDVAADAVIYSGAMVALNAAGYAVPAAANAAFKTDGHAEESVSNIGGANGAKKVLVRKSTYRFANSAGGDLITRADLLTNCFVVDDQTVARTSNANARPVAGIIVDVDSVGVWVRF